MGIKIELENGTKFEIEDKGIELKFEELVKKATLKKTKNFIEKGYSGKSYFIDFVGKVKFYLSTIDSIKAFNEFTNSEYAEKIAFKQYIERKLLWYKDKYDDKEIDWDNPHQKKYYICEQESRIHYNWYCTNKIQGIIFFSSGELVNRIIEEMQDELIQYFNLGL